jgi:hypothetical protein
MRRLLLHLIPLAWGGLAVAGCASSGGSTATAPELTVTAQADLTAAEAAKTITASQTKARIAYLASDAMRGRDTPSPELEQAATYLAGEFESFGLKPAGDGGTFIQRYPYKKVALAPATIRFELIADSVNSWALGSDFFIIPSTVASAQAVPVFVGRLQDAVAGLPEEVVGRIVLVAMPPQIGVQTLQALRVAEAAGAVGMVFLMHPSIDETVVGQITGQLLAGTAPVQPIPSVGLRYEAARSIFEAAGLDLDSVAERETVAPVALSGVELLMQATTIETEHQPPNVVAMLAGSDPVRASEYVVFSAHFDHVGVGQPDATGDSIYNGADDDASGTAVLVEVAQAFASLETPPARSLLFLAVSGEEKGLLGSMYFSANPTVPIDAIVADVNMDMVGRNAPDTVIQIGGEYSSLGPLILEVAQSKPGIDLVIVPDPDPAENAFFRSDHVAFVKHEIPSIFLTSWLHDDYHKPSDEPDKIDGDKAARIGRLVFYLGYAIANGAEPPEWTDEGLAFIRQVLKQLPF